MNNVMRPTKGKAPNLGSREVRFNPKRGSGGNNVARPKKSVSVMDSKETRFDPKK